MSATVLEGNMCRPGLSGPPGRNELIALALAGAITASGSAQQTIPPQWHQRLTDRERAWTSQVVDALRTVPDFPKLAAPVHLRYGVEPRMQINAWEQGREITVPVEMLRFLESDASAFAFLLAHEAGHAKQEEMYGQSCYTAVGQYKFSTFDWTRTFADIAGAAIEGLRNGGARNGGAGAAEAMSIAQKQACEDNADAWGVHFLRRTRGADLNGATRFFDKLMKLEWQSLTQQFTSDHSIDVVRIAHVAALIANGK
jgi:Zn-dependent protease with chaperone function